MNLDDERTERKSRARVPSERTSETRTLRRLEVRSRCSILALAHSPDVTGLSVQALAAIMDSSTMPVNSRSRWSRAVPGTRWTPRSLIIAVPDGREGARPASRLRVRVPRACFSASCNIPSLFRRHAQTPPRRASATLESSPLLRYPHAKFRLNPTHLSLINR